MNPSDDGRLTSAADNRDRYEHDENPTLSAKPVLVARIDASHFVPFSLSSRFG